MNTTCLGCGAPCGPGHACVYCLRPYVPAPTPPSRRPRRLTPAETMTELYNVGFADPRLIYNAKTQTIQRREHGVVTLVATLEQLYGGDRG